MWAHLGAMLAYLEGNVGPSWGYVGPSWGYVGPSWSYVGPSWGYVGPSWGLCCSILGLCWSLLGAMLAHLEAMLVRLEAHVGPCWPMLTHLEPQDPKNGKNKGRAKYPVKRRIFWPDRVGRRQGRRPLSPTERRETPSARTRPGGPWPD